MSARSASITRTRTRTRSPRTAGRCIAGAAELDITPYEGIPVGGYSSDSLWSRGVFGRLRARVLYLEDAGGNCAALVYADLHSGTRYILEKIAQVTAAVDGIAVDKLILAGTHTQTGPGHIYGNTLYDFHASSKRGFDQPMADWIATQIANAVHSARLVAAPAMAGFGAVRVWGVSRNRSLRAHRKNRPEAAMWNRAGWPGAGAPYHLDETQGTQLRC